MNMICLARIRRTFLIFLWLILIQSLSFAIGEPSNDTLCWWKGNLHTHTTGSDGDMYPEVVAEWYKSQGYNFLAITDHGRILDGTEWVDAANKRGGKRALKIYRERFGASWVEERMENDRRMIHIKSLKQIQSKLEEPNRFLLLYGEEMGGNWVDSQAKAWPIHVNAINPSVPVSRERKHYPTALQELQSYIDAIVAQGKETGRPTLAVVNHPNFHFALTGETLAGIRNTPFFEIYNGVTNNYGGDDVSVERKWDIALALRLSTLKLGPLYATGSDDAHHCPPPGEKGGGTGRAWIVVRAPRLTVDGILAAMNAGDFYASTGVCLDDLRREGKQIVLKIKPEKGVTYTTQFIGTLQGTDIQSKPKLGKDGKLLVNVTGVYSDEIGKVLAEVEGLSPRYTFRGSELYVRVKILSSKPKNPPQLEGEVETAWTQPFLPSR